MHMALRDILDMIFSVIKTAQPVDILDILVLSYVVYLGMKLIRETRAGQLIKGIFLLLLVYIIASWINMKGRVYQTGAAVQRQLQRGQRCVEPHH